MWQNRGLFPVGKRLNRDEFIFWLTLLFLKLHNVAKQWRARFSIVANPALFRHNLIRSKAETVRKWPGNCVLCRLFS